MGGGQLYLGEVMEAGVAGADVPAVLGAAKNGGNGGCAGGAVACGFGDEVGRIGADGEALDVEGIGRCPGRCAVYSESHLAVEVVEGKCHVAVACGAVGVDLSGMVGGHEVVVASISLALYLRDGIGFGLLVGGCYHAVVHGLHYIWGSNLEGCVVQGDT